jgi:hypothetical protein
MGVRDGIFCGGGFRRGGFVVDAQTISLLQLQIVVAVVEAVAVTHGGAPFRMLLFFYSITYFSRFVKGFGTNLSSLGGEFENSQKNIDKKGNV